MVGNEFDDGAIVKRYGFALGVDVASGTAVTGDILRIIDLEYPAAEQHDPKRFIGLSLKKFSQSLLKLFWRHHAQNLKKWRLLRLNYNIGRAVFKVDARRPPTEKEKIALAYMATRKDN
jgi:hypothetical protein